MKKGSPGCERRCDPFRDPPKVGTPVLGNSAFQTPYYLSDSARWLCAESHPGRSATQIGIFVMAITATKLNRSILKLAEF